MGPPGEKIASIKYDLESRRAAQLPTGRQRGRLMTPPVAVATTQIMATEIYNMLASTEPAARNKMLIAHRYDIAGAGVEAVLKAGGHCVIASCSDEDDAGPLGARR